MFSVECEKCIDYKSPTHGHVIHGIKDMAQGFVNAYAPTTCDTLLRALRRWRLIEFQENISAAQLIKIIFDAVKLELGDSKHCDNNFYIHPLETNYQQISKYFYNIENGVVDEILGIKMMYHQKCVKCKYQWFNFAIENFINLPIHGLHARYWMEADGDVLSHSFDIIPEHVLDLSLQQLVLQALSDYEELDDDIEMEVKQHFVYVNKHPKYFVYWTYLGDNLMWYGKQFCDFQITVYEYVKQLKYTLVLSEIPTSVTKYDKVTLQENKYDFVAVVWPELDKNNDINIIQEEKKAEGETNCAKVPEGNNTISLIYQWEQYINNGQIIEDRCPQCESIQKIISKPQIFALPTNPILYINQQQLNYYKLSWPYQNNLLHISIKQNHKQQTQTFQINSFISQQTNNNFKVHWRTKYKDSDEKFWYTLINDEEIARNEKIQDSEHACVFMLTTMTK